MPSCAVRYKIELLCQLPKPRFEAKVLFGDILSFLVCRQKCLQNSDPSQRIVKGLEGQRGEFLGRDLPVGGVYGWQR